MAQILEQDIVTISGVQWAASLRYHVASFGNSYITGLDDLCIAFCPESTASSALNLGDVIEIQGPAASGKTQLLYFLCMTTSLARDWAVELSIKNSSRPPRSETMPLGGKGRAVVVFDADGKWSTARLAHMIRSHLSRRVKEYTNTIPALYGALPSEDSIQREVDKTLGRVHLFRPTSTVSLAASITRLPAYLAEHLPDDQCTLILIDSITAFYWQDRAALEQQAAQRTNEGSSSLAFTHPIRHVITALSRLRSTLGPVIVMTTWALAPLPAPNQTTASRVTFYRSLLPHPYPTPFNENVMSYPFDASDPLKQPLPNIPLPLTHHITLEPMPIETLPKGTTIKQATGDLGKRQLQSIRTAAIRGHLRIPGVQTSSHHSVGDFVFRVVDVGLEC